MNLKNLEQATEIYKRIKKLDKEISELNSIAILLGNEETECSFELKVKDLQKEKDDSEKVTIDSDGSLNFHKGNNDFGESAQEIYQRLMNARILSHNPLISSGSIKNSDDTKYAKILKNDISDITALNLLGVILIAKQDERRNHVLWLESIGVNL